MARRLRSDSNGAAVAAFRAAQEELEWPVETVDRMKRLEDQERADFIFRQIMSSRPPADFRAHDRTLAAMLAVTEVGIAVLQAQIDNEGFITLGGKSGTTQIKHPALDAQQFLVNRQIQLCRALGLVGVGLDLRTVRNNAKTVDEARKVIERGNNESMSLLA